MSIITEPIRVPARRTLVLGVVGFAAASAVGSAAPDGAMLIAVRAVEGAFVPIAWLISAGAPRR